MAKAAFQECTSLSENKKCFSYSCILSVRLAFFEFDHEIGIESELCGYLTFIEKCKMYAASVTILFSFQLPMKNRK